MNPTLDTVLVYARTVLSVIGGGTVVTAIGWLFKRKQETFENAVLNLFAKPDQRWYRTADQIHNDFRKKFVGDVPMWVLFPPEPGFRSRIKWLIKTIPHQLRHLWRMNVLMPSEKKVDRTVLRLWKTGLLIRDQTYMDHYTLKS
jgi:hypothetical protein